MSIVNVYVFRKIENIRYYVIAGYIDKELLRRIREAILNFTYNTDKTLKLNIFNATATVDKFY